MEAGLAIVVLAVALDRLQPGRCAPAPAAVDRSGRRSGSAIRPRCCALARRSLFTRLLGLAVPAFANLSAIAARSRPRRLWKAAGRMAERELLRHVRDVQDGGCSCLCAQSRCSAFCWGCPGSARCSLLGARGLAARRRAARRSSSLRFALFCAVTGNLGTDHGHRLSRRRLGRHRGADRHPDRHLRLAQRPRAGGSCKPIIDTLQTLPSFVFIIPVVMLFRVGDFTAMIAIVLFAIVPAIRYTALGIRAGPPALIEAATAMGSTRRQLFWQGAAAAGAAGDHARHQPDDHAGDLMLIIIGAWSARAISGRRSLSRSPRPMSGAASWRGSGSP